MATVDTLITSAQSYVTSVQDLADDAIDRMRSDVNNVGFTAISFTGATLPTEPELPEVLTAPTFNTVTYDAPAEPDATLEFQDISDIETGDTPVLDATAPTISLPSAPSQLAEFTGTAPVIQTDYVFPDPPDALEQPFPTEPELQTITLPTAPSLALPSLTAEPPTDDTQAPTDIAASFIASFREISPVFMEAVEGQVDAMLAKYNPQFHTQMAAIESQLSTYLEGGTGLAPAVEDAIYARAQAKNEAEARRATEAGFNEAAARGWTIPPGAATAGARRARQAAADNNAAAAREIVVMQAEMEQKNLQFAVSTSLSLRQVILSAAMNYHQNLISINSQALEYSKAVVGMAVEVYNIQVRAFGVRLDAYRAAVAAYDARLKGTMAAIDLYKAEIEAQQTLVSVDRAKVDLYRSRVDALDALAKVYKSRIDVVVEQAGLEKLKLDLFRTQVEAYTAQAQGKRAELDAYTAAISGQEARVRIFSSQVDAYRGQVDGFRAKIQAQAEVVQAKVQANDSQVKQFQARMDGYKTVAMVRGETVRTQLEVQKQAYNAFDSQVRANIANAEVGATIYSAKARVHLENARLSVDTLVKNAELNLQRSKEVASLGVASAEVYKGLAGAALSGMNTLVAQTLAE